MNFLILLMSLAAQGVVGARRPKPNRIKGIPGPGRTSNGTPRNIQAQPNTRLLTAFMFEGIVVAIRSSEMSTPAAKWVLRFPPQAKKPMVFGIRQICPIMEEVQVDSKAGGMEGLGNPKAEVGEASSLLGRPIGLAEGNLIA
jgi:hypothetical protein